jgi:hypothetical protein
LFKVGDRNEIYFHPLPKQKTLTLTLSRNGRGDRKKISDHSLSMMLRQVSVANKFPSLVKRGARQRGRFLSGTIKRFKIKIPLVKKRGPLLFKVGDMRFALSIIYFQGF